MEVKNTVARRVRAWIETVCHISLSDFIVSHAVCVRGLKHELIEEAEKYIDGRTPCACVD